jgi:Arc/MetJ-type ribon-helix-helix transcriptional regulator
MKAVTINISLNPELAEFARSDSEARAFDSMSEYMRDLIRNRRQEQIAAGSDSRTAGNRPEMKRRK